MGPLWLTRAIYAPFLPCPSYLKDARCLPLRPATGTRLREKFKNQFLSFLFQSLFSLVAEFGCKKSQKCLSQYPILATTPAGEKVSHTYLLSAVSVRVNALAIRRAVLGLASGPRSSGRMMKSALAESL